MVSELHVATRPDTSAGRHCFSYGVFLVHHCVPVEPNGQPPTRGGSFCLPPHLAAFSPEAKTTFSPCQKKSHVEMLQGQDFLDLEGKNCMS